MNCNAANGYGVDSCVCIASFGRSSCPVGGAMNSPICVMSRALKGGGLG